MKWEKSNKELLKIFFSKKFIDQDDCHPFFCVYISQCTWFQYSNRKHSWNSFYHFSLSIYIVDVGGYVQIQYKYIKGVELGDTFEILCVLTLNGFHKIFIFFDYLLDDIGGYIWVQRVIAYLNIGFVL